MTSPALPYDSAPVNAPAPVAERPTEEEGPSVVFWLIVGITVLYLAVRFVQGVVWAIERIG